MTTPDPTISIPVDVTSPGQFFACCGLLELASRLDDRAEGWFVPSAFTISGQVGDLITKLRAARFRQVSLGVEALRLRNGKLPKSPKTVEPIAIELVDGAALVLDWWLRPSEHSGLKLWSGSNAVAALFEDVFEVIRSDNAVDILNATIQLKRQPFFYSAVRPLHERDIGISMDKIGRVFAHFPYVELLALIGLQRFRPATTERETFRYCTWKSPLPTSIAAPVASGTMWNLAEGIFEFPVIDRDSNGHRQFTRAERRFHVRPSQQV